MSASILTDAKIMTFIASAKPDEAKAFYSEKLGLEFLEDNGFSLIFAVGGGLELRVQRVESLTPQRFTVFGWQVDDIEDAVATLSARGVQFLQVGMPGQDERGIWTVPGEVKIAWFEDPDGNNLSITQPLAS